MNEPTISMPLSTFNEMLAALDAAIAFRSNQLVSESVDDPHYDGWSRDFSVWGDMRKTFSRSNGEEAK